MKDIRQKLLATFQVEHRDHVEQIRSLLALIEKTGGTGKSDELDEVFRRAHSLKGAARAVDLSPVEELAHGLETLFSRVRQGAMAFDKESSGVVHQVLDASEDCVAALGENRATPGFQPVLQAIRQVLGIQPATVRPTPVETSEPVPAFQPLDTVRITTENFDALLESAGELLIESQRQELVTTHLRGMARQIAGIEKQTDQLRRLGMRREFSRLRSPLDSVDRKARSLSKAADALRRVQQRGSRNMQRLGKQLQRDVWRARMVPAETLLEGYRKMVRDLARDQSKQIEFRAVSTGVHADRRVLDALKDPLMHVLRNAISHGVETPEERLAKGKPPMAVVTLAIDTKGTRLTIVVEDDGRGLDLARVLEVAVRQGILTESEAARRSPDELARIVFKAGFSTARTVTDLSGRGMGLSVVYEAIRRLQGDVELRPAGGGGTSVHLSVPLSISSHRLLLVSSCGQTFAVPIHGIERLHRIRLTKVETVEGKPVLSLDGQPVPLFSLQHLLHLEQKNQASDSGTTGWDPDMIRVVVLRIAGRRAAVTVDAFLRETDAVIKDLGPAAPSDGKVSGGILIENGAIALTLNLTELLENAMHPDSASFLKPTAQSPLPALVSILVVDDSITTRTLEKSILEAQGYRVRVAVDGLEALAELRAEKADLVITDVQMPRMDGFGLLGAMKQDQTLKNIPVIVVTSLERREDQERGLSLGADAYIVKRKFEQGELLATIRQII